MLDPFKANPTDAIVHAAAQPSHDKAASIPFDDFEVNATGTLNILEAARKFCPEAPLFICPPTKYTATDQTT